MDTSALFSNEDLLESKRTQKEMETENRRALIEQETKTGSKRARAEDLLQESENLSARELNRLKRKSKLEAKSKEEPEESSDTKRIKRDALDLADKPDLAPGENWMICNSWPFTRFLDVLLEDMFACKWEKRHGSVTAIRE